MNKRHHRHIKRRFIIREQLTGYRPAADQELPYSDQYLIFKELSQQAGLEKPGLSVRHLRHTSLTLLLQSGADLFALKKLAGHKTLKSTQIYLRVSQNQLREAIKKHPLK